MVDDKLHKLRDDTGLEVDIHVPPGGLHPLYYNPLIRPKLSHQFVSICTAGKPSMAILSDGTVVPCIELKDLICRNILESEVKDIWNSNWMTFLRNEVIPENYEGLCGLCPFKYGCYSARCLAYRFTGSLLGDDLTCAFIRKSNQEVNLFRKLTNEALLSLSK